VNDLDFLPALPDDEDLVPSPIVKKEAAKIRLPARGPLSTKTLIECARAIIVQEGRAERRHLGHDVVVGRAIRASSFRSPTSS
jgi:hypothetical protein